RLSGSGWYETDFKSAGEKKKNLTESSSAGGDAKPAATAESKPAAKPASDPA
ncbi:transcriptional regulator, partial [Xanthomonas perforans]